MSRYSHVTNCFTNYSLWLFNNIFYTPASILDGRRKTMVRRKYTSVDSLVCLSGMILAAADQLIFFNRFFPNMFSPYFIGCIKKGIFSPITAYCCIALFFLFKMTHLEIPYYWDELWVYSKAALYMYDNEITLLPGVLPPELSRGHPLICAAFFAAAYRVLGPHVWVGHLAALAVSILLLVLTYQGGKKLANHTTGMIACLLLMLQSVFIAQSSMVLPEVLLALFSTAALFAYIGNRFKMFALYASLSIMTKETAIAIPVAVWSIEALRWFLGRRAEAVKALSAAFVPIACWGAFLLLQNTAHGWFFGFFSLCTPIMSPSQWIRSFPGGAIM